MSANIVNQAAYLRASREFPQEAQPLSVELTKMYIDVANATNNRTIGLFSTRIPSINGEQWFMGGASTKQQGLRQIYPVTGTGSIPHGINLAQISQFTKPSGSFTDGTNWYGLIYASNVTIAGQVTFYISPTNIVVQAGGGAPAIVSGIIILEWLALT